MRYFMMCVMWAIAVGILIGAVWIAPSAGNLFKIIATVFLLVNVGLFTIEARKW